MIRTAREGDAEELLNIYSAYIPTPVTFAYELPKKEAFCQSMQKIQAEYPYLVWEEEGELKGYAYAHRLREHAAYQKSAELTIYLRRDSLGQGIGKKLYTELLRRLKEQGIRMVYGCVTVPNENSEKLHLSLGFKLTGIFHKVGIKDGNWYDVSWFEKDLQEDMI